MAAKQKEQRTNNDKWNLKSLPYQGFLSNVPEQDPLPRQQILTNFGTFQRRTMSPPSGNDLDNRPTLRPATEVKKNVKR